MKTRICLFDDNKEIRNSMSLIFEMDKEIELVDAFENCEEVVRKIKACDAKVVIMDIEIPPKSGIEAVKEIRKELKDVIVIMFTVFDDDERLFESICAGADGYLIKSISSNGMKMAIKEAITGGAPMSPPIARRVLKLFQEKNQIIKAPNYELTPRELEILKHLTQGLSYKMIADVCHISFETTRSHIKNVYGKLQVASMTEAVIKAINEKIV